MKQWRDWHDVCEGCGEGVQTLSEHHRVVGDLVRCVHCQCLGRVEIDFMGIYAEWPEDICAQCYREMDAKLLEVTKRVISKLSSNCYEFVTPFAFGELMMEDFRV